MLPSARQSLATILACVVTHTSLELGPEVADKALDGPREGLAEGADGVTLDLLGELLEHVNLAAARLAVLEALHDLFGPLGSLAAGRALAAGLVPVELGQPGNGADNISRLVHDDDRRGTKSRLRVLESIVIHQLVVTNLARQDGGGRASGDDGLEVVPTYIS